ncbi:hypothetical protein NDU88_005490 [Pleurodeles waltl]|uniref:Uncharacterized protein n=1 Tax=Pleurodeles waltl TaxID=8319 RepID=A0AAV7QKT3_PLEWA|nr:hypothetical protein NDU88_005490 [Pleurodeles waltl]
MTNLAQLNQPMNERALVAGLSLSLLEPPACATPMSHGSLRFGSVETGKQQRHHTVFEQYKAAWDRVIRPGSSQASINRMYESGTLGALDRDEASETRMRQS